MFRFEDPVCWDTLNLSCLELVFQHRVEIWGEGKALVLC